MEAIVGAGKYTYRVHEDWAHEGRVSEDRAQEDRVSEDRAD